MIPALPSWLPLAISCLAVLVSAVSARNATRLALQRNRLARRCELLEAELRALRAVRRAP